MSIRKGLELEDRISSPQAWPNLTEAIKVVAMSEPASIYSLTLVAGFPKGYRKAPILSTNPFPQLCFLSFNLNFLVVKLHSAVMIKLF
jgi:hypothetical protein